MKGHNDAGRNHGGRTRRRGRKKRSAAACTHISGSSGDEQKDGQDQLGHVEGQRIRTSTTEVLQTPDSTIDRSILAHVGRKDMEVPGDSEKLSLRVGVFWDIENCQVMHGRSATAVVQRIRERFFRGHEEVEFMCVCDITKESNLVIQELNDSQVNIVHVSATSKNAADDKLRQSMRRFADLYPPPTTVILITGDINFASELSDLRYRKRMHVILLHNNHAPNSLLVCANEHYSFTEIMSDVPLRPLPKSTNQLVDLFVRNLPTSKANGKIISRLKKISYNCGGKVMWVNGSTACVRFSSSDVAVRAKKRMDREDVYGNRIVVGYYPDVNTAEDWEGGEEEDESSKSKGVCCENYNGKQDPAMTELLTTPIGATGGSRITETGSISPESNSSGQAYGGACGGTTQDEDEPIPPMSIKYFRGFPGESNGRSAPLAISFPSPPAKWKTECFNASVLRDEDESSDSTAKEKGKWQSWEYLGNSMSSAVPTWKCTWNDSPETPKKSINGWYKPAPAPDPSDKIPPLLNGHPNGHARKTEYRPRLAPPEVTPRLPNDRFPRITTQYQDWYPTGKKLEPVELQITNLDQSIEIKELKRLLLAVFRLHVMVLHVAAYMQSDGSVAAAVKVPSLQHAQVAISQLHRARIGTKRISISYPNQHGPSMEVLRSQVVALLQEVPQARLPLFKFRELYEQRYHSSVATADLYKMKEVVNISEEHSGRMVGLAEADSSSGTPRSSPVSPVCSVHSSSSHEDRGWAESQVDSFLPCVWIGLKTLTVRVHSLLQSHNGVLALASLPICYEAEYGPLEKNEEGVLLENLLTWIPGIKICAQSGGFRVLRWQENSREQEEDAAVGVTPQLAGQIALFCRELVDLIKQAPRARMQFSRFIPAYHHHFGRQCRVADYGYTKLIDLFEALGHLVQVVGDGHRRMVTLTARSQIKRFTSDLLRVLKVQTAKQLTLSELPAAFERVLGHAFSTVDYGVCELADILGEISENTVVVTNTDSETAIAIPKREQTPEEMERTKQFASEVVDLLRHAPQYRMEFNKLVPAYHHHFSRQCRVSDYGFTKLAELLEAIPDVVQVTEQPDGERTLSLTGEEQLKVLGEQIISLIEANRCQSVPVNNLLERFRNQYGFNLRPNAYGAPDLDTLLANLRGVVEVVPIHSGRVIMAVDRGYVHRLSTQVKYLLFAVQDGRIRLDEFCAAYRRKWGQNIDLKCIETNLDKVVQVEEDAGACYVRLRPLQMVARNIVALVQESGGRLPLQSFEAQYLERFGEPCRPAQHACLSVVALLQTMPDMVVVKGKGRRRNIFANEDLYDMRNLVPPPPTAVSAGEREPEVGTVPLGEVGATVLPNPSQSVRAGIPTNIFVPTYGTQPMVPQVAAAAMPCQVETPCPTEMARVASVASEEGSIDNSGTSSRSSGGGKRRRSRLAAQFDNPLMDPDNSAVIGQL